MNVSSSSYIGRFAPTPTGPLHLGSLVAALASYLDAKAHDGQWQLRIEDLDPPREDPHASHTIARQLQQHGLYWDGDIQYQSQHSQRYEQALGQLAAAGVTFACQCSRKQLTAHHGLHQGRCIPCNKTAPCAVRLLVPDTVFELNDRVFGHYQHNLLHTVGDQVLKRKDGLYAYQLAVVVDDSACNVTHVVRGVDLLDNTPRQLYLMECLKVTRPQYLHVPLVTNDHGQKLSKQNQAMALDENRAAHNLLFALKFLNQPPPPANVCEISKILNFAVAHWDSQVIKPHTDGLMDR